MVKLLVLVWLYYSGGVLLFQIVYTESTDTVHEMKGNTYCICCCAVGCKSSEPAVKEENLDQIEKEENLYKIDAEENRALKLILQLTVAFDVF